MGSVGIQTPYLLRSYFMIKAAIFDLDGLMFDTESVWDMTLSPALESQGYKSFDGLMDMVRGTSGVVLQNILKDHFGQDLDAQAVCDEMNALALEEFKKGAPMKPGLVEMLEYLTSHNVVCGVASSSDMDMIETHLEVHGITKYFTSITSGQEVSLSKPNPDIFLLAAKRLGVDPSDAIVFEDSFLGVRAGFSGGFRVVMVPDMQQPTEDIREKTSFVCDSLNEARTVLIENNLI